MNQSPFVRELAPGLVEEWVEGFGGGISRRAAGGFGSPGAFQPRPATRPQGMQPPQEHAAYDDCQLPPEHAAGGAGGRPFAAGGPAGPAGNDGYGRYSRPEAPPPTATSSQGGDTPGQGHLCYCQHRIFGRGKIIRHISPEKVQVNFPGFGLKIILSEYLLMEN